MPGRLATVPYIGVRQRRGKGVAASHPTRAGHSGPTASRVDAPKKNYGIRRDEAGFPQDKRRPSAMAEATTRLTADANRSLGERRPGERKKT